MTPDEWKEVENALICHSRCFIKADEYEIRLQLVPYSPTKNVIYVFVDDKNSATICLEDCEERRRFFQPHKHSLLSTTDKKKVKRERKAVRDEVEKMTTYYTYYPWWSSFRSMKAHFTANNKDISLL